MPIYFIRAELLNASGEQYQHMHDSMRNGGYNRTIKYPDGFIGQLPTGCYFGFSIENCTFVRDYVKALTKIVGVTAYIFVCQMDEYASDLPPA